ncbi:hypothetical protein Droror1_Dr00007908 [Drosera rotundifolia]
MTRGIWEFWELGQLMFFPLSFTPHHSRPIWSILSLHLSLSNPTNRDLIPNPAPCTSPHHQTPYCSFSSPVNLLLLSPPLAPPPQSPHLSPVPIAAAAASKGGDEKEVGDLRRTMWPTPLSFFVGSTFEGASRDLGFQLMYLWIGFLASHSDDLLLCCAYFLAANHLNIKSLLDLTCQTMADMIKEKTPEEIHKTFNIKNDFTPEEEEEVRRDNQWAFE